MKVVAFVPIKFKSQRLENKNILPLGKFPLCWYIFESLKQVKNIDEIYVYCSDDRIVKYIPNDIKFLERPTHLDRNETKGLEIYTSFINTVDADVYILAHATSPFIRSFSIQKGLDSILNDGHDSAFSVQKMQTYGWYQNKPLNYELDNVVRTQDLDSVLLETSAFYIFKKDILQNGRRIGNNPHRVITDRIESVDIDEVDDYRLAQAIMTSYDFTYNFDNLSNNQKNPFNHNIKMVIMDYDGTLSTGLCHIDSLRYKFDNSNIDGGIYNATTYDSSQYINVSKCYNSKDGFIIKDLSKRGITFAIVSGANMDFFNWKAKDLGIKYIYGNVDDKKKLIKNMLSIEEMRGNKIDLKTEVAYIGDDNNDIEIGESVAIFGCPNNSSKKVKQKSQYISPCNGGEGAVRDFLEYLFPDTY